MKCESVWLDQRVSGAEVEEEGRMDVNDRRRSPIL